MFIFPVTFPDLHGDTLLAEILARDTALGYDLRVLNLDQADRRTLLLKLADAYWEIDMLTEPEGASPAAGTDLWSTIEKLRAWVDTAQAEVSDDARRLVHALKVAEESGEVAQAAIGALGRNVRKGGVTHSWDDVGHELVDVIVTAMVALVAIAPEGAPQMFAGRLAYIASRAGLVATTATFADGAPPSTLAGRAGLTPGGLSALKPPTDGLTEDFLAGLAAAYRELVAAKRAPGPVIAEQTGRPVGTVHRWIGEARKRGHLPPARRGRAG